MSFKIKYHFSIVLLLLFINLVGCKLQDPYKNHGITFLDNRSKKLTINKSNFNDVINVMGQPHTKSIGDDSTWIYIERVLTKGDYHKLGKNILKSNLSKSSLLFMISFKLCHFRSSLLFSEIVY